MSIRQLWNMKISIFLLKWKVLKHFVIFRLKKCSYVNLIELYGIGITILPMAIRYRDKLNDDNVDYEKKKNVNYTSIKYYYFVNTCISNYSNKIKLDVYL